MCVCVCEHEQLERVWIVLCVVCVRVCESQCSESVEVVSARRGNLLYKRRADVSYVYPRSHSTKEPYIPSHSNPGPSLSWFSDINNVLFHFPFFFFFFSPCPAQLRTQRSTRNRFQFLIRCERETEELTVIIDGKACHR